MHDRRACSILASVQDAQVRAAQALNGMVAVVNRSRTSTGTPSVSSQVVTDTLLCFKESLKAVTSRPEAEHAAAQAPGVHARQADHAICQQAAQVLLRALLKSLCKLKLLGWHVHCAGKDK